MGISVIGASSSDNNFSVDIGATGNNVIVLDREYVSGGYSITSQLSDTTLDIYAINADGSLVGYTNTKALSCSRGFSRLVVLGATNNDLLSFEYKTTFSPTETGTVGGAGAYITSITPTDLPNINNTITINGGNFSTNVAVTFTGTNNAVLNAKSIVRVSSTQLLVTRPDNLIQDHSPYDLTVTNPGITPPTTVQYIISNGVTAGGDPTWVTASGALPTGLQNAAYSATVSATDPDGAAITYALVSGSLPTGLQLDSATGVIAGTPSVGNTFNFTLSATDPSGNVTNRSFSINVQPVVQATGGTITTSGGYRIHTFTSSGTLTVSSGGPVEYLIVAGGGGGGNTMGGGGGAGGMLTGSSTITSGTYSIAVGSGGGGASNRSITAGSGSNSSFNSLVAIGGGGGASWDGPAAATGGSGGGGVNGKGGAAGTAGQGNAGGSSAGNGTGGGGGGATGAGFGGSTIGDFPGRGGVGTSSSISGTATFYAGGGGGGGANGFGYPSADRQGGNGGGGNGGLSANGANGTANTGGGGGGGGFGPGDFSGGAGGTGIVIVRYLVP